MKSKTRKIISFIVIVVGGVIFGLLISFYIMLRLSVPQTKGTMTLEGLAQPVEITFDSLGIPQIWAATERDGYFALGYQHAADRLFQMDLTRRVATGSLSELIGPATLALDKEQRQMGHFRMAREALTRLSPRDRDLIQAYTDGVNAYVAHARALPFEYRFLPEKFKPWQVTDCLAIFSFQTWFSNALMNRDEFYRDLAAKVGEERAKSLLFPYPDWAPTTVPEKPYTGSLDESPTRRVESFREYLAHAITHRIREVSSMCYASNAWVVAPSHSASGRAMLASDPHLELTRLPQFWYPVGLHVLDSSLNVLGITAAGLPFFAMGHNGKSAWAFTAGGVDVIDYVDVKLDPDDSTSYLVGNESRKFRIEIDSFVVAGADSLVAAPQRYTIFGPIVGTAQDSTTLVALHWVGFDIDLSSGLQNAFALANVSSFTEFQHIVTGLGALDANMMYADSEGNIGYQLTTPIRKSETVLPFTRPADLRDTISWKQFLPTGETPSAYNPDRGWLASCNNLPSRSMVVPGYFFATRILSITDYLSSTKTFNVENMDEFQMSHRDAYLLRMQDEFVRVARMTGMTEKAKLLEDWDGSTSLDSWATALINVYLDRLQQLTFEDELGDLWHQVPSKWIEDVGRVDSAGWFDDVRSKDQIESYDTIAVRAMNSAIQAVDSRTWGELQSFSMQHPMSTIPILGDLLNLGTKAEPWGGAPGALNASFYRSVGGDKFESVAGPSWRFVIDFADVDSTTMVIPAGVSGNPMSTHFLDFYPMWKTGGRWIVPFHHEQVAARAVSTLTLTPGSPKETDQ